MFQLTHTERLAPVESQAQPNPNVGDDVLASDGRVGRVAALVTTEAHEPRYVVVRTGRLWRRHPVIAIDLIDNVSADGIVVRGERRALIQLPESLPLVI
jgi:hypothetical protein